MLARGLDAQTAFEIVSIDIADIDVGENIGARLQADQAEADMRVARAKAEAQAGGGRGHRTGNESNGGGEPSSARNGRGRCSARDGRGVPTRRHLFHRPGRQRLTGLVLRPDTSAVFRPQMVYLRLSVAAGSHPRAPPSTSGSATQAAVREHVAMERPEEDTVEFERPSTLESLLYVRRDARVRVVVGVVSGSRERARRESGPLSRVARPRERKKVLLTNMAREDFFNPVDESYAIVVADGVGGAAFGGIASRLALRTTWELAGRAVCSIIENGCSGRPRGEAPRGRLRCCHSARVPGRRRNLPGAGQDGHHLDVRVHRRRSRRRRAHWRSRAYLYRQGTARRLTRDHTCAQDLLDAGLPPEDTVAYAHMLTRCFSSSASHVSPDVNHARLQDGDCLLLCTDGLSDLMDDAELASHIDRYSDPQAACNALLRLAWPGAGRDNVTVVVARVTVRTSRGGKRPRIGRCVTNGRRPAAWQVGERVMDNYQRVLFVDVASGFHQIARYQVGRPFFGPVDLGLHLSTKHDSLNFGAGLLAGSIFPGSNRLIVTGYSPAWRGFYISTMGGAAPCSTTWA